MHRDSSQRAELRVAANRTIPQVLRDLRRLGHGLDPRRRPPCRGVVEAEEATRRQVPVAFVREGSLVVHLVPQHFVIPALRDVGPPLQAANLGLPIVDEEAVLSNGVVRGLGEVHVVPPRQIALLKPEGLPHLFHHLGQVGVVHAVKQQQLEAPTLNAWHQRAHDLHRELGPVAAKLDDLRAIEAQVLGARVDESKLLLRRGEGQEHPADDGVPQRRDVYAPVFDD
mmetsp:Transcript_31748/g.87712  ORF Transcript_31748/g.87712 Transcript_31748/m.87712 type:complete len:226 (+) Transcript_31748:740-1417(+)